MGAMFGTPHLTEMLYVHDLLMGVCVAASPSIFPSVISYVYL